MSYLPELLIGQPVALAVNANIPVALRCITVEEEQPYKHMRTCHVLINGSGRPIGKWSSSAQNVYGGLSTPDGVVNIERLGLEGWATPEQRLNVSMYALLKLMPFHPTSLLALQERSEEKWKDVGTNVGEIDIPLIYPHLLPLSGLDAGIERAAGLQGYELGEQVQTSLKTSAGNMAYAGMIEPMLETLDKFVMQPNGFKNCGNPFKAYIARGLVDGEEPRKCFTGSRYLLPCDGGKLPH